VAHNPRSVTGKWLAPLLDRRVPVAR
jgi:hypothetical protein